MVLKKGDLITWNIKRGVNGEGRILAIYNDDGIKRYKVRVTKDIIFKGKSGKLLRKGEIVYPFKPRRK